MPELPDVEVFKRYLEETSRWKVESVEVKEEKILGAASARKLERTLEGRRFESTRRHGKNFFVELDDGGWLLMHFGMTGSLKYFEDVAEDPRHDRLLIAFESGYHLAFEDQRMLEKVDLIGDPEDFVEEHDLGPNLLDLSFSSFREPLRGKKGSVKSVLINQQLFAGVRNIYSDEILFQTRVHPKTGAERLDEESVKKLHDEAQRVLRVAIQGEANPHELPDSFLLSHRREGERCPRDNGKIQKIKVSGRTAYYCPAC